MEDIFEEEIEAVKEKEKQAKDKRKRDVKKVLSTAEGRRFIWDLIGRGCIFNSIYSPDTHEMARLEGRRQLALEIFLEVNNEHTDAYIQIQAEYLSLKKQEESEELKSKKDKEY
jgi:hypothetical protein